MSRGNVGSAHDFLAAAALQQSKGRSELKSGDLCVCVV